MRQARYVASGQARRRSGWYVALSLFLVGAGVGVLFLSQPHAPASAPLPVHTFQAHIRPSDAPVVPPSAATPPAPSRLIVPALGINAPLLPEGITDHALVIPGDVADVGQWIGGASVTSQEGTVLLAGHVDYVGQGNGALYPLFRVQAGATVYVTGARGELSAWRVNSSYYAPKHQLPQNVFTPSGPRRLVMVTCGGPFDPATRSYRDNVVVTAVPVRTGIF